jgi:hypothetical protein
MRNSTTIGHAKFWTDSDDILHCQFNNNDADYRMEADNAKLYIAAITDLCKGKAMPFLIDIRNSRGTFSSLAAKLMSKSPELKNVRISEAFVINNMAIRLLITNYKRVYDPKTPFVIFKDVEEARNYCIDTKNTYYEGL